MVLLGLLDLNADFDCVDHKILLSRLRYRFGLRGSAYHWIASFLYGRSQQVFYKGRLSAKLQLLFGVPQGSVLLSSRDGSTIPSVLLRTGQITNWTIQLAIRHNRECDPPHCATAAVALLYMAL